MTSRKTLQAMASFRPPRTKRKTRASRKMLRKTQRIMQNKIGAFDAGLMGNLSFIFSLPGASAPTESDQNFLWVALAMRFHADLPAHIQHGAGGTVRQLAGADVLAKWN